MTNKIALITGGSRGLGRNMAHHLAAKGTNILFTYRERRDEADSLIEELKLMGRKAVALPLDTGVSASFPAFAAQVKDALKANWGRDDFDFLINNAGMALYAPFAEVTEAQFDGIINVHFKGVVFLTQALLPLIKDGGRILNLSSGLARFSYPGSSIYGATKAAIDALTRYMALELGPRRITVNAIAPGAIETDFGGGRVRDNADINATIAKQTPLGRVGLPDDIGGAVALLLSDEAGWINGQRIEVAGGIHA
ncbi:SDR family NAD(P)-dependent oxidoreductase [Asticcacaulis taihuensis]|uniref:NAD(P)-dependent dehydrogenase, short-chain alcohol dehydrogenase family n=1 Tax=Asticcacaulis taihuensis TaxID=260084 RepID=A0A1G4RGZ5_9CAUL|nr:SDR family oxidoreductase [Asticcacaulis taihuensis]SCW56070.1 NAD(P)-dependent dehydrogenase, short-chain alcohol dehydrogenase family [Asticcacaulis taihuensis]